MKLLSLFEFYGAWSMSGLASLDWHRNTLFVTTATFGHGHLSDHISLLEQNMYSVYRGKEAAGMTPKL